MPSVRLYSLIASIGLPLTVLALDGCKIVECSDGAVCTDPDEPGNTGGADGDLCSAFCARLETCDVIASASEPKCIDSCHAAMEENPDATKDGCQCVIEAACGATDECPGAPIPNGSSGSGTGAAGGTGATGAGGSGAGNGGGGGEGATPCTKSCECPEGEICEAGACTTPAPEPTSCVDDCDCPSGEICTSGTCG